MNTTPTAGRKGQAFTLRVDEQRMRVTLAVVAPQFIVADEILAKMRADNLVVDDTIRERISHIAESVKAMTEPPPPIVLCEGKPPQPGQNGRIEWDPRLTHQQAEQNPVDGSIDHYASRLLTVAEGEVLARVLPPTPGTPGIDVLGQEVAPRAGLPATVNLSGGCQLTAEGSIVADVAGTLNIRGDRISVTEGLHIQNVDFSTGHVQTPRDLSVDGQVSDLFRVSAGGNAEIGGDGSAPGSSRTP